MIPAEFCSIESEMQRVNRPLHFAKCAQKLTVKPGGKLLPSQDKAKVPSRFMRKFIRRLRLSEVSRQ